MLDAGGLQVRVRVEGDGEPLLLLNGLHQSLESWDPFVASLDGRTVIRFDAPGVGESAMPTVPPSMASMAAITAAVLDALDLDRVDVVGFSLGGAVAQQLAHAYPARVRRLVLVATSCGLGSTLGRWALADVGTVPSRAMGWAAVRSMWWQSTAIATWSSISFLGNLTQPTLVVCGRDDAVAPPSNSRVLASRIPGARLVTLPLDHQMQRPGPAGELAQVVEGFLRGRDDHQSRSSDGEPTPLSLSLDFF